MMKYKFIVLFLILVPLFLFGFAARTNAVSMSLVPTSVSVTILPENPGPNQTVTVLINSYGTNLDSAYIMWKVNDKEEQKGIGLKQFMFKTGDMGSSTKLTISIETYEGEFIEKTYTIVPTSVDLVWQVKGFTPPFYKGKTMFGYQSEITFVAIPHILGQDGSEVPAKNLIYKWTRNGTVLGDFSGYGRNTFTMMGSIIARPIKMEVEVTSPDAGGVGYAQISVEPMVPTLVFYERNPLYGIEFQRALSGDIELKGSKEIAVVGFPLFFSVSNLLDDTLLYKWAINGARIENGSNPAVKVFRQEGDSSGTSNISLSVENSQEILQYASGNFNISFGEDDRGTNTFSF